MPPSVAFLVILGLRLITGLVQSPVCPGNGSIVASWFPTSERGTASAIFNSSQYFSLVMFASVLGWITHRWGWKECRGWKERTTGRGGGGVRCAASVGGVHGRGGWSAGGSGYRGARASTRRQSAELLRRRYRPSCLFVAAAQPRQIHGLCAPDGRGQQCHSPPTRSATFHTCRQR